MLKAVVGAKLPLVAVRTRDTINFLDVFQHITKVKPVPWMGGESLKTNPPGTIFAAIHPRGAPGTYGGLYAKLMKSQCTLVVANPLGIEPEMFDAGEMPVPKDMVVSLMESVTDDAEKASVLAKTLGGLTIKEAAELAQLTMAETGALLPAGVLTTRKAFFQGQAGLTLIDPAQAYYQPTTELLEWTQKERKFFFEATDPRLMPRGLLLDGPPGTGKTSGAKYIAEQWGVPLYRVDVGATKNKYVGESEGNMLANLARLDSEEPCIALFDEVEKVFHNDQNDSSGTSSAMMSQLLWWMAERKTRVLVVMTTNKAKALPKELHREGRIDKTMMFLGLNDYYEVQKLAEELLKTFGGPKASASDLDTIVKGCMKTIDPGQAVPHALVAQSVYAFVKAHS